MFERSAAEKIKTVYFIALAVLMYYFLTEAVVIGVAFTYRHLFAIAIVISGFVCFLARPDIGRFSVSVKSALVYSVPLLVEVTVSLLVWLVDKSDFKAIARGLSMQFFFNNMLSFALAAAVFLYLFGEKGIWYNLLAIIISNLMIIVTIIMENGAGAYFSELTTLITTFAGETGKIIMQAEVHELAFCLGAYLIYMILKPQRTKPLFWILFILAGFCFLSAFKRIAMVAIAVALLLGWILLKLEKNHPKTARSFMTLVMSIAVILLVAYIGFIKNDGFTMLEKAGVDTNGRAKIYQQVDSLYQFSPTFIGNGIGFLNYELSLDSSRSVDAIHNDFLQFFIDLGFWGYILWLISMTFARIRYFGRSGNTDSAVITFVMIVYLLLVSTTDNTMNYPLVTTVIGLIMMGHGYDERVRTENLQRFGYEQDPERGRLQ